MELPATALFTNSTSSLMKRAIAKFAPHPVRSGIGVHSLPSSGGYVATVESPMKRKVGFTDSSTLDATLVMEIERIETTPDSPLSLREVAS